MQNPEKTPKDSEILKVAKEYLVQPSSTSENGESSIPFHLPGASVTSDIYKFVDTIKADQIKRSASFEDLTHDSDNEFSHLNTPGGFRRNFILQHSQNPKGSSSGINSPSDMEDATISRTESLGLVSTYNTSISGPTRHVLDFLVLEHFAGEDLSDSDSDDHDYSRGSEQSALLPRRRHHRYGATTEVEDSSNSHKTGTLKTMILLMKAFIGSGVLFLPKAFSNGGLGFSIVVIWLVGLLSLVCFLRLLRCKEFISGSYGDIGGHLYGPWMRRIVKFSVAISQFGFVCGGNVFIAENVTTVVASLTNQQVQLRPADILIPTAFLLMPLVLIRRISKLSPTALASDVLIVLGLSVLIFYFGWCIFTPRGDQPPPTTGPNIHWGFNSDYFTVFVGTAVYSFEGIGLIIPIRDAMKHPQHFPWVLTLVMSIVAFVLCLVGTSGYIAFGSNIKTVALLNLPPGIFPSLIEIGYSLAVILSNALMLFPTVRILEQAIFGEKTGKYNPRIKWQKNILRTMVVMAASLVAWIGAADLDKFISLIGSVCCCPLSLIFPPMFHMRLSSTTYYQKKLDIALATFGVGVMLFTFYSTSNQWGS